MPIIFAVKPLLGGNFFIRKFSTDLFESFRRFIDQINNRNEKSRARRIRTRDLQDYSHAR